jgi:hypothetical protein
MPPSPWFASIANLQQPRCVLRFQTPFRQTKKSAQKIDGQVGPISDIARFFWLPSEMTEHWMIASVWKMTEKSAGPGRQARELTGERS